MSASSPLHVLALASYVKGDRFLRRVHSRGHKVSLVTVAKHLGAPEWPREVLAEVHAVPDGSPRSLTVQLAAYLSRATQFDRVVALDDYDVETAAAVREHLRLPGLGDSGARYFRDKLAMRVKARAAGIPVPEFIHVLNYDALREFMARVPAPWMLKPRGEAAAVGIRKLHDPEQVWRALDSLGDEQSNFLLEQYIPGEICHVDSLVYAGKVVLAEAHRCGTPPFDVAHGGGIFTSMTVERGSGLEWRLRELNQQVLHALDLARGTSHTEYILGHNGTLYFMETSARVGGAFITDMVEASTGLNVWEEWADIELATEDHPYVLPALRQEHAGLALTLARQEWPDMGAYQDPEIVLRVKKFHHAGLVVRAPDYARVNALIQGYEKRLRQDFHASQPAPDKPQD